MKLSHLAPVFWLALLLVSGELLLEARAHGRGFETLLFPVPPVDASSDVTAVFGPTDGFPFRSPVVPKGEPGIRLWFGSSSYAEDSGLPPDLVFPNRVAALLTEAGGRPVAALNRSKAGYTVDTNVRHLRREGPAWRPDVAVLYQLTNDLSELTEIFAAGGGEGLPGAPGLEASAADDGAVGPEGDDGDESEMVPLGSLLQSLYEKTTLFAQMRGNVTPYLTRQRFLPDRAPPAADDLFRARVEAFVDAANRVGAVPVLVTLATLDDDADDIPVDLRNYSARWAADISSEGYYATVASWNGIIREVARARGVALVDLAEALRGQPGLFRDFTHFTADGHRRAAEVLAQRLAGIVGTPERVE